MTGETFGAVGDSSQTTITSSNCNPNGTSTFTFSSSGQASGTFDPDNGLAAGPYPGTFTKTGAVTLGPQAAGMGALPAPGTVTSFQASFTITPAPGDTSYNQVTGTKKLDTSRGALVAQCLEFTNNPVYGNGHFYYVNGDSVYDTRISAAEGTFADRGLAPLTLTNFTGDAPGVPTESGLFQQFYSDLANTEPLAPTSKDQCKGGGWTAYPEFKNQGDCVSFVETGK